MTPTPARTRLAFLRPFTTRFFNPVSRHVTGWLPFFGTLIYRGRTTGKRYRTPMNVFRRGDHYLFALTYGADVQWVKNIVATGTCEMQTMGRVVRLVEPEVFVDPARREMPALVRVVLGLMRVTEFLRMRVA